jgi:hypothetical protein
MFGVNPVPDDRSRAARAYDLAWRVITVSVEMVLPGAFGYWVDQQLGTVCLFLLAGSALGLTLGIQHLIKFSRSLPPDSSRPSHDSKRE